ncbi:MAG: methionyl-tRNA formyltransferase [bacterium]|nr:methionyl-tRNA formyltransferase [bacterium]
MRRNIKSKRERGVYIIAGSRPWNEAVFKEKISKYPGRWHFISRKEDLTLKYVQRIRPRYIFFLHWSWFIPPEIYESHECIVFHMTDLPFGRGGSPLQNLLVRGVYKTKISAVRVVEKLDTGPVYSKKPLDLKEGRAEDLYKKASAMASGMIKEVITRHPKPYSQKGKIVVFKRRKPEESKIPSGLTDRGLYDFIRMLDADGYPRAFVESDDYTIEFSRAILTENGVSAEAVFIKK